jgi:hypothetical protein
MKELGIKAPVSNPRCVVQYSIRCIGGPCPRVTDGVVDNDRLDW